MDRSPRNMWRDFPRPRRRPLRRPRQRGGGGDGAAGVVEVGQVPVHAVVLHHGDPGGGDGGHSDDLQVAVAERATGAAGRGVDRLAVTVGH